MVFAFPILAVVGGCVSVPAPEPDGSRTLGIVPPFRGQPSPPRWLREASHHLVACSGRFARHYRYEAYADGAGGWLVQYRQFPAAEEFVTATRQVFLFTSDPLEVPFPLRPGEIRFEARRATWQGRCFSLVDGRDLIRAPRPSVP